MTDHYKTVNNVFAALDGSEYQEPGIPSFVYNHYNEKGKERDHCSSKALAKNCKNRVTDSSDITKMFCCRTQWSKCTALM